jgi:hypothetical protein
MLTPSVWFSLDASCSFENGSLIHLNGTSSSSLVLSHSQFQSVSSSVINGGVFYLKNIPSVNVFECAFISGNATKFFFILYFFFFLISMLFFFFYLLFFLFSSGGFFYFVNCLTIIITSSQFSLGTSVSCGGALYFEEGCSFSLSSCSFMDNNAGQYGGSVASVSNGVGMRTVTGCTFVNGICRDSRGVDIWDNSTTGFVCICRIHYLFINLILFFSYLQYSTQFIGNCTPSSVDVSSGCSFYWAAVQVVADCMFASSCAKSDVYVSNQLGKDNALCGQMQQPCATLAMATKEGNCKLVANIHVAGPIPLTYDLAVGWSPSLSFIGMQLEAFAVVVARQTFSASPVFWSYNGSISLTYLEV